ncbi:MAG: MarC family protein [Victivallales bacterium]
MKTFSEIFLNSLYLLALINPISKICILSVFSKEADSKKEFNKIVMHSTLIALMILSMVMLFGEFLFHSFLRVELYSLKIAGGSILFCVGFKALSKGIFFEQNAQTRLSEISIVPLASPMIAGPATIAAALPMTVINGFTISFSAVTIAIFVNMVFMLLARPIGNVLVRFNIMGALIRITGLIVATIGVQMVLSGIAAWLITTRVS